MISRRSVLGFLGLAPVAAIAAKVLPAATDKMPAPIDAPHISAITADIGEVRAGVLRSKDHRVCIDLNGNTISISGFTDEPAAEPAAA